MSKKSDGKDPEKSLDLPPYGARNADPLTDQPGSHPIEAGVGAALGGAASGAAVGMVLGPPGVIAGAVVGAVAGGLAGKGVGELIDPTTQDNWIREWLDRREHEKQASDEHAALAYRFGLQSEFEHPNRTFDDVEPELRTKWHDRYGADGPDWDNVRGSARAGYERMHTFRTRA
ncbi:hypothetical protein R5W24_000417 [Gemmata sp. JC717]|uniref:hypothetical protein n=1 Tax=Gemmata algarum TaxID=2975278 RepID=UPI0021BB18F2|nr:hypothetical protein [Gemmata algarum]MDY3551342.1 hypothetical protein [Gemmata algarum]